MAKTDSLNPEPVRWSLIAPILAAIVYFAPVPAWVVEDFYSRDMYPWLQHLVTSATNVLPIAVLDVLILAAAFAVLYRIRRLYFVARQRGIVDAVWEGARRVARAVAIAAVLFYWAWGFNYRRLPIDDSSGAGRASLTVDVLQAGVSDASALASNLRPIVSGDPGNLDTIRLALSGPMNQALDAVRRPRLRTPGRPKTSLVLSPFFRWSGVTGMINPFGLESIVSPDLLPFERPFVVAHEWAHLSGQADEAEASAVGWLACMKGDAASAYSASLFLIAEGASALPAPARTAALARLDAGVRADLDAIAARMRQQNPRIQRTTSRVYDEYLRANRVTDGTASYSRALSLILRSPFREGLSNFVLKR